VAAFTAAQKVAANHVDTHLSGDDERTDWAKRSVASWTHRLSAVEPESVHIRSRDSSLTSLDSRSESSREDSNISEPISSKLQLLSNDDASALLVSAGVARRPSNSSESESITARSVDPEMPTLDLFDSQALSDPLESTFAQGDLGSLLSTLPAASDVESSSTDADHPTTSLADDSMLSESFRSATKTMPILRQILRFS